MADALALKSIDSRHEGLQALASGTLGAVAAREAATNDVSALDGIADNTLRSRATAVMGDTAEQHVAYRIALQEVSPQYAGLAERAYADEQQRSAEKEDRKTLEYASRRDDAADSIAGSRTHQCSPRSAFETKSQRRPRLNINPISAIPPISSERLVGSGTALALEYLKA